MSLHAGLAAVVRGVADLIGGGGRAVDPPLSVRVEAHTRTTHTQTTHKAHTNIEQQTGTKPHCILQLLNDGHWLIHGVNEQFLCRLYSIVLLFFLAATPAKIAYKWSSNHSEM